MRKTSSRCKGLSPLKFRPSGNRLLLILGAPLFFSTACMVGPKYQRPAAPVPGAYKEQPPPGTGQASNWKPAQPNDGAVRGKWWEIFDDQPLNALEDQINISNQNVLAAEAQFRAARDSVRIARSALFPTAAAGVTYNNSRTSSTMFNV